VKHPGTIEFVDGATGEVTRTERADSVPETIAFADGRPVTRIVITESEERREIRSYGEDGSFLSATYQVAE